MKKMRTTRTTRTTRLTVLAIALAGLLQGCSYPDSNDPIYEDKAGTWIIEQRSLSPHCKDFFSSSTVTYKPGTKPCEINETIIKAYAGNDPKECLYSLEVPSKVSKKRYINKEDYIKELQDMFDYNITINMIKFQSSFAEFQLRDPESGWDHLFKTFKISKY